MKSQPQNPEFRNNSENFHPCKLVCAYSEDSYQPAHSHSLISLIFQPEESIT